MQEKKERRMDKIEAARRLLEMLDALPPDGSAGPSVKCVEDCLWDVLRLYAGESFRTAKGLEFTYAVRGNEMFVSRKDKSLTRATVMLAFYRALELQRGGEKITGPKKLGTFGASYIYPVFIAVGLIRL